MNRRIILVIALIVFLILSALFKLWFNKWQSKKTVIITDPNIIKQPKGYLYIGIFSLPISLALGLFVLLAPDRMFADSGMELRLVFFMFQIVLCLAGLFIVMQQINWKIEIGKDEFTFTNLFRKKRRYKFNEVEVRFCSYGSRFFYKGIKIVTIYHLQLNWYALEKAIADYERRNRRY